MEGLSAIIKRRKERGSMDYVTPPVRELLQRSLSSSSSLVQHSASDDSSGSIDLVELYISGASAVQGKDGLRRLLQAAQPIRIVVNVAKSIPLASHTFEQLTNEAGAAVEVVPLGVLACGVVEEGSAHLRDFLDALADREATFAAAMESGSVGTVTQLVVPIYVLHMPLDDDASQRLSTVLPAFSRFVDAVGMLGRSHADLLASNNRRLVAHPLWNVSNAAPSSFAPCESLRDSTQRGPSVLVHCLQGISRSVAMVVWYLFDLVATARSRRGLGIPQGVTVNAILDAVRTVRPCACPNLCFAAELRALEQRLRQANDAQ